MLVKDDDTAAFVAYKPITDSPPTDLSTVYIMMKQCQNKCKHINLISSEQTMGQQVYATTQKNQVEQS